MADNMIEQFFIDIELNTRGVSKQAKEIDKMLDSMGMRASRRTQSIAKAQTKANSTLLADMLKAEDVKARRTEALSTKASSAQMKQHVQKMTAQDAELKKMKEFYRQQEKLAKVAAKRQQAFANKIARFQSTAYYQNMKSSGKDMSSYDKRFGDAVRVGDAAAMTRLASEMRSVNRETKSLKRNMMGLNVVQGGLQDSTRNMIRSYASLFALFEGTVAIKRVGMDYEGMNAAMLAASGSTEAAANDMIFLNGMVDQMGLNLKNTTDAWVKFKFAAKGKISQEQQEDIFTGLSMFGTSLKVGDEDMKRSQRAIIQIDDYCLAA